MAPCMDQVYQSFGIYLRVKPYRKFRPLGCYTPTTVTCVAFTAYGTTHGYECCGSNCNSISAKGNCLCSICTAPDAAGCYDGCLVPYAFLPQPLIHRSKGIFNRYTEMVADDNRRSASSTSETININNVSPCPYNS